jgi:replicative DNA helicase
VVSETRSDWIRYLALLFWGRSCEDLNRVEEAIEHYRQAAGICRECQVPRVALSNAHRKAGNREEAMTVAASVADIRTATVVDPWFEYYFGQHHRVREMLLELRREVGIPSAGVR